MFQGFKGGFLVEWLGLVILQIARSDKPFQDQSGQPAKSKVKIPPPCRFLSPTLLFTLIGLLAQADKGVALWLGAGVDIAVLLNPNVIGPLEKMIDGMTGGNYLNQQQQPGPGGNQVPGTPGNTPPGQEFTPGGVGFGTPGTGGQGASTGLH